MGVCRSKCQQWNVHARFILATVCQWIWFKMQGISTLCTREHSSWCLTFVGSLWFWCNWDTWLNCVSSNLCGCLRIRHCQPKLPKNESCRVWCRPNLGFKHHVCSVELGEMVADPFAGGETLPFSLDVVPHLVPCASWLPSFKISSNGLLLPRRSFSCLLCTQPSHITRIAPVKKGISLGRLSPQRSQGWIPLVILMKLVYEIICTT